MILEIFCVGPIIPQYSGVLETCLALRFWFFEVLGSESVNVHNGHLLLYQYTWENPPENKGLKPIENVIMIT